MDEVWMWMRRWTLVIMKEYIHTNGRKGNHDGHWRRRKEKKKGGREREIEKAGGMT